ncbi:single-stranded DNA-binding protein [Clostridium sp.]|uniref:single-stranded DNA-binding protein n=1 Tax=Clostridium sp. TaxID=1506 RepID=UPI003216D42B
MNKTMLLGRVTKDIELRFGKDGMAIAKFSVAVNRMKKGETDFINCIAFGKTAETIANYMKKGSQIGIEGHIQTGSYTNKEGNRVYTTDVIVDRMDFVGGGNNNNTNNQSGGQQGIPSDYFGGGDMSPVDDGEMPF